jgi:hypothetical protein
VDAVHILVVGGYGHVGGRVSKILASSGYAVRVAGRNIKKARRLAANVGAEGVFFDACEGRSWDAALSGIELVVVCIDLPDDGLPRRVLASGKRYMDISADDRVLNAIERLDPVAKEQGGTALLSVGLAPGLTNMMAHAVAHRVGAPQEINIAVMLGAGDSHGTKATDWMIAELAQAEGRSRTFSFARDQRRRKAWPLGFADQHVLMRIMPGVRVRTYFTLNNHFLSAYLFSIGPLLSRSRWLRPFLRRALMLFRFGSRRTAIAVTASRDGAQAATARFEGGEEAKLTAQIAARAAILLLAGVLQPGVHHLGQAVGLDQFVDLFEPDALSFDGPMGQVTSA